MLTISAGTSSADPLQSFTPHQDAFNVGRRGGEGHGEGGGMARSNHEIKRHLNHKLGTWRTNFPTRPINGIKLQILTELRLGNLIPISAVTMPNARIIISDYRCRTVMMTIALHSFVIKPKRARNSTAATWISPASIRVSRRHSSRSHIAAAPAAGLGRQPPRGPPASVRIAGGARAERPGFISPRPRLISSGPRVSSPRPRGKRGHKRKPHCRE